MPRQVFSSQFPEADRIAQEVGLYPRLFTDLLKFLMDKYLETIESLAAKMHCDRRTIERLRSPKYHPTLDDIRGICLAMKLNMVDGIQLLCSGGFNPAASDSETISIILICSSQTL